MTYRARTRVIHVATDRVEIPIRTSVVLLIVYSRHLLIKEQIYEQNITQGDKSLVSFPLNPVK